MKKDKVRFPYPFAIFILIFAVPIFVIGVGALAYSIKLAIFVTVMGLCGILLALFSGLFKQHLPRIYKWTSRILVCVALIFSVIILAACIQISAESRADSDTPEDATLVVLGCALSPSDHTTPSLMLSRRLQAALSYLQSHPDSVCVVSGGQGDDENISEALSMYTWLTERGIDAGRIIMEDQSLRTAENLAYTSDIINAQGLSKDVLIVTDTFHQFRAKYYARQCGLTPYSLSASTPFALEAFFWLRETVAVVQQFWLKINTETVPPPVSLSPAQSPAPGVSPAVTNTPVLTNAPVITTTPIVTPVSGGFTIPDDILDNLPESGYTTGEKYIQYYGEPKYEFIPADYGEIIPYYAGYDTIGECFGFSTKDGSVICEPIYRNLRMPACGGYIVGAFTALGTDIVAYDSIKVNDISMKEYYISPDGTVMLSAGIDYDKLNITPDDAYYDTSTFITYLGDKYLSVLRGAKFYVYDNRGNLVFNRSFDYSPLYGEGVFTIFDKETMSYSYIDESGKTLFTRPIDGKTLFASDVIVSDEQIVLSWLRLPLYFSEGLTVYYENELSGYMDKSGSVVIPAEYETAYSFCNGLTVVSDDVKCYIIDISGNIVFEEEYIVPITAERGPVFYVYANDNYKYYDYDLNLIEEDSVYWWDPLYDWQFYDEFDAVISSTAGCYLVIDGKYAGVVDENGGWIVKRLLLRYAED